MNDKEFCDAVHLEIHTVRRIAGYKPSPMEKNISKLVIEKFKDKCKECKEVGEQIKSIPQKKSGILDTIKSSITGG
jgi:hypothetical protein